MGETCYSWEFYGNRADVRTYSLIPQWVLSILSSKKIKGMYDKAHYQAIDEYISDPMCGSTEDFDAIATATVRLEREIMRRKMERRPLNKNYKALELSGPDIFATDVWSKYLK